MFKVGQKVVFISESIPNFFMSCPAKGEIVTIKSFDYDFDETSIVLVEYEFAPSGLPQCYATKRFRPLDYDFVEEVIEQVKPEKIEI